MDHLRTRTYSATGQGIRVWPMNSNPPQYRAARNLFEAAAMCDQIADAKIKLGNALGITDFRLADTNLTWADRWRKLPVEARIRELAGWMVAECYDLLDLVECDRINTAGD